MHFPQQPPPQPQPRPEPQQQRPQSPLAQLPPKKAKKWPWILGIVAAFFIGTGVGAAGSGGSPVPAVAAGDDTADAAPAASGGSIFSDGPYRLEATSEAGARIMVTYANGTGGIDQATVDSGWSIEIPEGTGYGGGSLSISTSTDWAMNNMDTSDTLTCRIYEGDELIIEQSGTGQIANATCSGY